MFLQASVILSTGGGVPGLFRGGGVYLVCSRGGGRDGTWSVPGGGYLVWSRGCTWSVPGKVYLVWSRGGGCTWSGPGGCTWQAPPGPGTAPRNQVHPLRPGTPPRPGTHRPRTRYTTRTRYTPPQTRYPPGTHPTGMHSCFLKSNWMVFSDGSRIFLGGGCRLTKWFYFSHFVLKIAYK